MIELRFIIRGLSTPYRSRDSKHSTADAGSSYGRYRRTTHGSVSATIAASLSAEFGTAAGSIVYQIFALLNSSKIVNKV